MASIIKTKSVKALLHVFEQADHVISVIALVKQLYQEMNKTTVKLQSSIH